MNQFAIHHFGIPKYHGIRYKLRIERLFTLRLTVSKQSTTLLFFVLALVVVTNHMFPLYWFVTKLDVALYTRCLFYQSIYGDLIFQLGNKNLGYTLSTEALPLPRITLSSHRFSHEPKCFIIYVLIPKLST